MENYKAIRETISSKAIKARDLNRRADDIYNSIRTESAAHFAATKNYKKPNYEEADKLYKKAAEIESDIKILKENLKASFAEYAAGVISDIMPKYTGKQYGPKTKEKIAEEARAAGVGFYFERGYRISVYAFNNDGFLDYGCKDIYISVLDENGHIFELISDTNKIEDITAVKLTHNYKYVADVSGRQSEIESKFEEYKKAWKAAYKLQNELNNLLPEEHKKYNAVGYYSQYERL